MTFSSFIYEKKNGFFLYRVANANAETLFPARTQIHNYQHCVADILHNTFDSLCGKRNLFLATHLSDTSILESEKLHTHHFAESCLCWNWSPNVLWSNYCASHALWLIFASLAGFKIQKYNVKAPLISLFRAQTQNWRKKRFSVVVRTTRDPSYLTAVEWKWIKLWPHAKGQKLKVALPVDTRPLETNDFDTAQKMW